ncbi:MAG TPA: cytochrome c [Gelidibacter sp.]|uniref:c-type cytochrome n=1 Tax=Gelidibacter sp. TaxID=2018083 RepID=UPI002D00BAE1|nr:cytochrome c [Gelidibacter sp.]HXJ97829.1 cytochrome c [Gelidibacter sp.]
MIGVFVFLSIVFSCNSEQLQPQEQSQELKESIKRGALVYEDFCMNCHLPDGKGTPNIYPPLADSDYLMKKREESIKAVKYGLAGEITVNGKKYNNAMASLGLLDDEVADVMNYILNSWGNADGKIVTVAEVSKIQP